MIIFYRYYYNKFILNTSSFYFIRDNDDHKKQMNIKFNLSKNLTSVILFYISFIQTIKLNLLYSLST